MPKPATADILSEMRSRLEMAVGALSESRVDQVSDLKFFAASPDNNWQWPDDVVKNRKTEDGQGGRPTLTINKLPQHVRQITNDQRQNRPSGKVIPVDDKGDPQIAEIYMGMVRHIEYISDADVAVDTACENQVAHGEGYIRILTDYCDSESFNQDIYIKRIRNSFSVYMDQTIQDPCGADAQWCLLVEDIARDTYRRQWPDAKPISSIEQMMGVGDNAARAWLTDKSIRIAEYFRIDHKQFRLNLYPGGQIIRSGTREAKALEAQGIGAIRSRDVQEPVVKWMKTNGFEVLEPEQEWPGKWIPVVRVVGNEFEVEGKLYLSGIVRNAKDAQRMYNYWTSQEAELLALAPKAPYIGYGGQFEGYQAKWKNANRVPYPYLEVNANAMDGQGRVLPLPQRAQPPMVQDGVIRAKIGASEDIKDATGQYNATLGQVSNERSAKAINARERQADIGTFHYADNLTRAMRYVTRQIVDLIPKIYDVPRIARIIGVDGETQMVKIDPTQQEAVREVQRPDGAIEKIYNPGVGKYDVMATTGPSYMTKRQEAREAMSEMLQHNPELWKVAGDLFIQNMDFPGASDMAKRIKRSIDPRLLDESDESPELQAAKQQIEVMSQEMEQMHQMLQQAGQSLEMREVEVKEFTAKTNAELEERRVEIEEMEARIKEFDSETKRIAALKPAPAPASRPQ